MASTDSDDETPLALTAYLVNDRAPEIRAGERRREWMEHSRDRYEKWSADRRRFNAGLGAGDARQAGSQQDYHHGRDRHGDRFAEHQTKIRVKPFPPGPGNHRRGG